MPGDTEERPFFQHFGEKIAAGFKGFRICIDALKARNLAIECPVIGQDFVVCVAQSSMEVFCQHRELLSYITVRKDSRE